MTSIELDLRMSYDCYARKGMTSTRWPDAVASLQPTGMSPVRLRVLRIEGRFHVGYVERRDGAIYMNAIAVLDTVEAARMCYETEASRQ